MLAECAVINSGPLVGLSLAGRLDLLPALFNEFWIPDLVFHEVAVAGLGRPGAEALTDARWSIHVRPTLEPDPLLIAELDPGEAAVAVDSDVRCERVLL
jgi:predicted nucleic acid-binding protein